MISRPSRTKIDPKSGVADESEEQSSGQHARARRLISKRELAEFMENHSHPFEELIEVVIRDSYVGGSGGHTIPSAKPGFLGSPSGRPFSIRHSSISLSRLYADLRRMGSFLTMSRSLLLILLELRGTSVNVLVEPL